MTLAPIPIASQRRWPPHLTLLLSGALLFLSGPLPAAAVMAQIPEVAKPSSPGSSENFAPSNPSQRGLAEHLRRQGYVFYGAWWCPACNQQKSLFGQPAAKRLPYLECDKGAAGQQRCSQAGIRAYPTWIKGGERREGVLTLEELKSWSGYRPGGATPTGPNR